MESSNLIEITEDKDYFLTEVPFIIGSEVESAERVRKHREKKVNLLNSDKNLLNKDSVLCKNGGKALQCNDLVTKCNTEKEKEKDKDIDIDIDKEF